MALLRREVVEDYGEELRPGLALVLKDLTVFTPRDAPPFMNITKKSIVSMFCNDPQGFGITTQTVVTLSKQQIQRLHNEAEKANKIARSALKMGENMSSSSLISSIGGVQNSSQRPNFQGQRPNFQGQRPNFQGPRPNFPSQRPNFHGQRMQFQGQRPSFQGPRPNFPSQRPNIHNQPSQIQVQRPILQEPRNPFPGPRFHSQDNVDVDLADLDEESIFGDF